MKKTLPKAFVPPHEMLSLPKDTPVLLALSGGADSASLLSMLAISCKESGAPLYAAHLDHMIRENEHERDRALCEKLAKNYGVTLFCECVDVPALAREAGESEELAARNARYAFFERIMREHSIPILVTAHNADDNLETLLLNLTRGSGLRGMCGIPQTRAFANGYIARPIISMTKAEILEYCKENGIEYVFDSSNACVDYSRNRIRAKVIPELKGINSSCLSSALSTSSLLRDDADFIDRETEKFLSENATDGIISLEALKNQPRAILSRALIRLSGAPLEHCHILDLITLIERAIPHSSLSLPQRKKAVIENSNLYFTDDARNELENNEDYSYPLSMGINAFDGFTVEIVPFTESSPKSQQTNKNIYKKEMKAVISIDKINGSLYVRNRRDGDTVFQGGMTKKLKKLMCEMKLPLKERSTLPIITDDSGILIVPFIAKRDDISCGGQSILITIGFTK